MLLAKNRKALYNYEVIDKLMAGIVLRGYEVKAVREGNANLEGSFVQIIDNEVYVTNMNISKYSKQSQMVEDDDVKRPRKLLLNAIEIQKLRKHSLEKGKTAVPIALLLRNNLVKLEVALVKGRKKHEKKLVAKERQIKKDLAIETKTNRISSF